MLWGSSRIFGRGHVDHLAIDVAGGDQFELLRKRLVERGASDGLVTDFGMQPNVRLVGVALLAGGANAMEKTPTGGIPRRRADV
jgi:hypothetical protein